MAKVMIVDDSKLMRRILRDILTNAGHIVVTEAKNGAEAIVKYSEFFPDIVTMDIGMPVMNGVQATERIIEFDHNARIIMLSAESENHLVIDSIKKGAKGYLIKPVNPERLKKTLNDHLPSNLIPRSKAVTKSADNIDPANQEIMRIQEESMENKKEEPFLIKNFDGTLKIYLSNEFDKESVIVLNGIISSLLYITPLKVVFDVEQVENMMQDTIDRLKGCIDRLYHARAEVSVIPAESGFTGILTEDMAAVAD